MTVEIGTLVPHRPSPGIKEAVYRMLQSVKRISPRRVITYAEEGRSSSGVLGLLGGVNLVANAASGERVQVAGVQVLPVVPELVDHLFDIRVRPHVNE